MRAIFISYGRDETEGYAGRLFQDLCERFGKDSVFMDVAGIEPGRDFRRVVERQVASCGVLLALIGKTWVSITDAQGKRRVDDPYDFVRLEVASALKRDIPVIPVLVQQADMPRAEQLPDDLRDLAYRNNVELTHARWASDVQVLVTALAPYVDASEPPAGAGVHDSSTRSRMPGWRAPVVAPLALLAIGGLAYVAWDRLAPDSNAPVPTSAPASRSAAASQPRAPTSAPSPQVAEAASANSASAETVSVPKRSVDKPTATRVPAPRHVEKPVVAREPERESAVAAAAPVPGSVASS